MKHRKFVKQLMSLGLDRNGAEMCAAYSRRIREPYATGMARFCRCLKEAEDVIESLPVTVTFDAQSIAVTKYDIAANVAELRRRGAMI